MSKYNVNIHHACYSLSDALDLVGVTNIHHGKRVAYIAAECIKQIGWRGTLLDNLFHAGIMHDCGVSKTIIHSHLKQLEWEGEEDHCQAGADLLLQCPPLANLSAIVRHHHTHWSNLKNLDLPEEIKLSANCIYLADRVDMLTITALNREPNILLNKDETVRQILNKNGDWFCPELIEAFLQISSSEAFWFCLESEHINGYAAEWITPEQNKEIDFSELRSLVRIFSVIVDAKSTFTKKHSDGVASLARLLGELHHLPERSCEMLELAGLLHDLGKLRVPDELLEKPGKLTQEEYSIVKRHSFDTFNILKSIQGFQEIALWAGQHHERIDGAGYPYHLNKNKISLEARIIAVADVFQALVQKRPYREPLPLEDILSALAAHVANGKLDQAIVQIVQENAQACWAAAKMEAD